MRVQFGDFVLDAESRQLMTAGAMVHVSPKAFDVLCQLVARRPAAVSKADLLELVWPGTFVVEANLTVLITELRRALGDDAQAPRFIRTVHRHGYAFSADAVDLSPARRADARLSAWLVWQDRVLPLVEGENLVGRDPSCAVWLDVPGVSRRHARLVVNGERATAEDLGSKNGTFVNERPLTAAHEVRDGDLLQLGPVDVTFRHWASRRGVETERISRTTPGASRLRPRGSS
jgi:DNA-binding winged helix-turn-helix (wHTH) protein